MTTTVFAVFAIGLSFLIGKTAAVAPVFGTTNYFIAVAEGTAAGTDVATVSVTDTDTTDTWTYTITSGNTNNDFAITNTGNPKVGTIASVNVLTQATTTIYLLTVSLSDGTTTVTTSVTIYFSAAATLAPMLLMTMMCSLFNYV